LLDFPHIRHCAFVERVNRTHRDEVLGASVFDSIEQVREVTEI
jgi:hypothetical protein